MNTQPLRNDFAAKVAATKVESWSAWRMGERESFPINLDAPLSLDDVVTQALAAHKLKAKDTLAVLYTHAGRNKRTLWLYRIKASTKRYRWRPAYDGGKPVKVCELEPSLLLETAVEAFAPVEPFDAFRDDPVGRDLTLVSR